MPHRCCPACRYELGCIGIVHTQQTMAQTASILDPASNPRGIIPKHEFLSPCIEFLGRTVGTMELKRGARRYAYIGCRQGQEQCAR